MKARRHLIIYETLIFILSVWLANQLASRFDFKIDLTEEKRYTLSAPTKQLLQKLEEPVFFEVYLEGDLPGHFVRFRSAVREMLAQFADESGNKVLFSFVDPSQAKNSEARNNFQRSLMTRGVEPTNLNYKSAKGDRMESLIFPGGIASMGVKEVPFNLLKGSRAASAEDQLNQAIEGIEYQLASAIVSLQSGRTKKIGYVAGHKSPDSLSMVGFKRLVASKYRLDEVLLADAESLSGYDAVVVAKPNSAFSEPEKYMLDQYLMRGGKLLFFIDALSLPGLDSVFGEGTIAIPRELNLTDMLFRYGVRVNANYVLDVNSGQFPVVTGNIGDQPQIQLIPWPFAPVLTHFSQHPSVRNLDAIRCQFVSEVDTVRAEGITKTPLLTSSAYTKVIGPPVRVAFNDLRDKLQPDRFTDGPKTIAYLLEGEFKSLYANRLIPRGFQKESFRERGEASKIIVVGDGDIIRNEIDPKTGAPLGLGVEPFSGVAYANNDFIMNLLEYMVDDSGLISSRAREVKLRPLDRVKILNDRTKWQLINLISPLLLLLFFGVIKWYLRKKKYTV